MPVLNVVKANYKNKKAIDNLIHYIFNWEKTPSRIVGCDGIYPIVEKYIIKEYKKTQKIFRKNNCRKAYHFILSFSEEEMDLLNPKDYLRIGYDFSAYFGNANHYVAFALHENTHNAHIHFAVNSVNYVTGCIYHWQHKDYHNLRDMAEALSLSLRNQA